MKTLVLLSAVQAAGLVFVAVRTISLEGRLDEVAAASPSLATASFSESAPSIDRPDDYGNAEIDAIRIMLREEIAILSNQLAALETQVADRSAPATAERVVTEKDEAALVAAFESEFNQALSLRNLSPLQMAKLEESIARLPPAERRKALSRLSRAMSDGSIDAKL